MNKKFYIYGYYGFNNFGDDLLLRALVENIITYRESEFWVRSFNKGPNLGNNVIYTEIDKIICDTSKNKIYRLSKYLKESFSYIKKVDCVIIGGGTLIHDNSSRWSIIIILIIVIFSKWLSKEVVFIGIGIADLKHNSSYFVLKWMTKLSSAFYIRDFEAEKILRKAKVGEEDFQVTADLAYTLTTLEKQPNTVTNNVGINVGITIVDSATDNNGIIKVITEYIALLNDVYSNVNVYLIPFHQMNTDYKYNVNDSKVIRALKQKIQLKNVVIEEQIEKNFNCIYANLDIVVGMRFHSLVLAAIYEIPFIGIAHDNKIIGICKSYDMPFVDMENITPGILIEMSKIVLNKKFPVNINVEMRAKALKNFEFFTYAKQE